MIRLATVFSGIGAIEHALDRMGLEHKLVFACDNGDVDILSKKVTISNSESLKSEFEKISKDVEKLKISSKKFNDYKEEILDKYSLVKDLYNEIINNNLVDKVINKKMNDISAQISMLYEKIKTLQILIELNEIKDYDERKIFVDKLYW